MASRSILGLISTLDGLRRLGEDVAPVLSRYGIDLDHVDPTARLDRDLELRIYTEVAEVLKDPLAGLKAGAGFGIGSYGPFTMLVMTCDTAYEAFRTGIRYQQLTYLFGTLRLETGTDLSALVLTPLPLPGKAFRFRVDGELSGTWKLVRDLQTTFGLDLSAAGIDMPYPKPPEHAAYEALFGCAVRWGEPEARCWIRNEDLQVRLPTADPAAHRYFRAQCDQLLTELNPAEEALTARVKLHLGLLAGSTPSAAGVAAALGVSERTFRRQLEAEGTGFRQLLDEVRYEKARQLLATTGQPVEAIAQQLGYAEAASFIHAFRRWSGDTPAAFRRRSRQPG
ncbi:MAG: AraC family transcriptional regulator ligand-binding domain-containing protein [Pseudomonadota bacterium]